LPKNATRYGADDSLSGTGFRPSGLVIDKAKSTP
jgi:hypothetical protein